MVKTHIFYWKLINCSPFDVAAVTAFAFSDCYPFVQLVPKIVEFANDALAFAERVRYYFAYYCAVVDSPNDVLNEKKNEFSFVVMPLYA